MSQAQTPWRARATATDNCDGPEYHRELAGIATRMGRISFATRDVLVNNLSAGLAAETALYFTERMSLAAKCGLSSGRAFSRRVSPALLAEKTVTILIITLVI